MICDLLSKLKNFGDLIIFPLLLPLPAVLLLPCASRTAVLHHAAFRGQAQAPEGKKREARRAEFGCGSGQKRGVEAGVVALQKTT